MNLFSLLGALSVTALSMRVPSAAQDNATDTSNDGVYEQVRISQTFDSSVYDNFVSNTESDTSTAVKFQTFTILNVKNNTDFDDHTYLSSIGSYSGNHYYDVSYNSDLGSLLNTDSQGNNILSDFKYATISTIMLEHKFRQSRHLFSVHRFDYVIFGNQLLQSPTPYYLNPYIYYIDNLNIVNTENSLQIRNTYCPNQAPDEYGYFTINFTYSFGDYPANPVYQMTNNMISRYLYGGLSNGYYSSVPQVNNYYHTLPMGVVYETASNSRGAYKCMVMDYNFRFSYRSYNAYQGSDADAYNQGFSDGYEDGLRDAEDIIGDRIFDDGYQHGKSDGEAIGYQDGYQKAVDDLAEVNTTAVTIFSGILDIGMIPINAFLTMLNFEVFGINIGGFVTGLFTIAIVVVITRLILGGKND